MRKVTQNTPSTNCTHSSDDLGGGAAAGARIVDGALKQCLKLRMVDGILGAL